MPCQILQLKSPYFLLYGSPPVVTHLRIFGCACFPLLKPYNSNKLQPKTSTCIFLGYARQYKGYFCFSIRTNYFFITRHVLFDESMFPYSSVIPTSPSTSSSPCLHPTVFPLISPPTPAAASQPTLSSSSSSQSALSHSSSSQPTLSPSLPILSSTQSPLPVDPDFQPEYLCVVLPLSPPNLHPMTIRSKNGISKRKAYSTSVQFVASSQVEPRSFKAASTIPEWQAAMREEFGALQAQGT